MVIFHISRKTRMIEKNLNFVSQHCYPKRAHRRWYFQSCPWSPASPCQGRRTSCQCRSCSRPQSPNHWESARSGWKDEMPNAWGRGKENRPSLESRLFPNEDKSRSKCPSPSPELQDRKGCQLTFGQADLQILNPSDRFPPASLHNISNGTKSLIAWVTQFWHHVTYLLEN